MWETKGSFWCLCADYGLDKLAAAGTKLKSVLLYHIHPNGSLSLDQLSAPGNISTVLGQDLNAPYPLQTGANATNGVRAPLLLLLLCRSSALSGVIRGPVMSCVSTCDALYSFGCDVFWAFVGVPEGVYHLAFACP